MADVRFNSATCVLELKVPTDSAALSPREEFLLRRFYHLVRKVCRVLFEFSARHFVRSPESYWRLESSRVRNDLLACPVLVCLADQVDWAVNSFDDIVERPEASYDSRRPELCFDWLQRVRLFFNRVSLLQTVCVRWLAVPDRLARLSAERIVVVPADELLHTSLYADFLNSYIAGSVRYPVGGRLPPSLQEDGF